MHPLDAQKNIRRWRTFGIILAMFLVGASLIAISALLTAFPGFWSTVLRDMGFVFCPVAVLALLYQQLFEEPHSEHVALRISDNVVTKIRTGIGRQEIVCIYPSRTAIDFKRFFEVAQERIDILTTNLRSMVLYVDTLCKKARHGVSVRVLTLNPVDPFSGSGHHPFLKTRYKDLDYNRVEQFSAQMVASLTNFCSTKEREFSAFESCSFKIRLYDNSPSIMMFRSDDELILGFILRQGRSSEFIHIQCDLRQVDEVPKSCCDFARHFDCVWNEAEDASTQLIEEIEEKVAHGEGPT